MIRKTNKNSRAQLETKILELQAQLASTYHFADATIDKASMNHLMASGVLLQLHYLGGAEVIPPVLIRDGLSPETILAIKKDLKRSYDLAIMYKPKEIK